MMHDTDQVRETLLLEQPDTFDRSAAMTDRARHLFPAGITRASVGTTRLSGRQEALSVYARAGKGAVLTDVDGNNYVDFHGNFSTLVHGHLHPGVTAAIRDQLESGICFGNPTAADLELAQALCTRIPAMERLRFLNSGTEAVMFAIKAARAVTGRTKIAKFEGAFHGTYDWAEVSVRTAPSAKPGGPLRAVPPYLGTPRNVCEEVIVLPFNEVGQTRQILEESGPDLSCILLDVLPGGVGMVPADPAYLSMLQEIARKHGILLISDEVVCFRLGLQGASATVGLEPDLVTLGKVVGGGLPIGVVGGKAGVMDAFAPEGGAAVPQGGTFSANPLTMSAGLATLAALQDAQIQHIGRLGERLRRGIDEIGLQVSLPVVAQGAGSLFRLHFKKERPRNFRDAFASAEEVAALRRLHAAMLERGIYVAAPFWGSISTVMSGSHIDAFLDALRDALQARSEPKDLRIKTGRTDAAKGDS